MQIERVVKSKIINSLKPGKVSILLGARRTGKTHLLNQINSEVKEKTLFLNGDDIQTHDFLSYRSTENYRNLIGDNSLLIIDEAQEIDEIGKKLKLIVDTIGIKVLITGSSAFELNNQVGEPLVGRMSVFNLFPISQMEFNKHESSFETNAKLENRLVFGGYPELLNMNSNSEKEKYLREITHSYLLKDILAFEGIKKRDKILALLQKIAFRAGSEISLEGLGNELQISKNTVEKYLDLFSKVFIMYSLSGFNRNADNEITRKKKWYFVDNGIRNALINRFSPLNAREDTGILWENYLQSERMKKNEYQDINTDFYFWRTTTKQEIDRLEVSGNTISAFEFKWGEKTKKIPPQFDKNYPGAEYLVIDRKNYLSFIA